MTLTFTSVVQINTKVASVLLLLLWQCKIIVLKHMY